MADIYVSTTGNDVTGDGSIGNPIASPGMAAYMASANDTNDTIHIDEGVYVIGTSLSNVPGGCVYPSVNNTKWLGYGATRPIFRLAPGVTGANIFRFSAQELLVDFLEFDGNNVSGSRGYFGSLASLISNSIGRNLKDVAFLCGSSAMAYNCEAIDSPTIGYYGSGIYVGCSAFNCQEGFTVSSATNCIAAENATRGFGDVGGWGAAYSGCIAYANTSHGFQCGTGLNCTDSISVGNGGYGFAGLDTGISARIYRYINCAAYGNSSGNVQASSASKQNFIDLSGDPFTDGPGRKFILTPAIAQMLYAAKFNLHTTQLISIGRRSFSLPS